MVRAPVVLAGVLAAVAIAYLPALGGGFVWDDRMLIEQADRVRDLGNLSAFWNQSFWAGVDYDQRVSDFFRPLVTLSFALDYRIHDGNAVGFHVSNLLLHLSCTALLFGLLRRSGARTSVAALLSALWALMPRLTESVAWISGRTDMLAALLSLASLWLWFEPAEGPEARGDPDAPERSPPAPLWRAVAAAVLLLLALFAKEVAAATLAAMAVYALRRYRGERKALVVRGALLAAVVLIYGVARANALSSSEEPLFVDESLGQRILVVLEAVGRYAFMALNPLQPRTQIGLRDAPDPGWAAVGALVVALLVAAVLRGRKQLLALPARDLAWLALGLTALGLVVHAIKLRINVSAADRFLYLPLMAAAALAAPRLDRQWPRLGRFKAALLVGMAILGARTFGRARMWADDIALWEDALKTSHPKNTLPFHESGILMAAEGMYAEALAAFSVPHTTSNQLRNRAIVLRRLGRCRDSMSLWSAIVKSPYARGGDWLLAARSALCLGEIERARELIEQGRAQRAPASLIQSFERELAELPELARRREQAPADSAAGCEARMLEALGWYRHPDAWQAALALVRTADATADQREQASVLLLKSGPLAAAEEAAERLAAAGDPHAEAVALAVRARAERVKRLEALTRLIPSAGD